MWGEQNAIYDWQESNNTASNHRAEQKHTVWDRHLCEIKAGVRRKICTSPPNTHTYAQRSACTCVHTHTQTYTYRQTVMEWLTHEQCCVCVSVHVFGCVLKVVTVHRTKRSLCLGVGFPVGHLILIPFPKWCVTLEDKVYKVPFSHCGYNNWSKNNGR